MAKPCRNAQEYALGTGALSWAFPFSQAPGKHPLGILSTPQTSQFHDLNLISNAFPFPSAPSSPCEARILRFITVEASCLESHIVAAAASLFLEALTRVHDPLREALAHTGGSTLLQEPAFSGEPSSPDKPSADWQPQPHLGAHSKPTESESHFNEFPR